MADQKPNRTRRLADGQPVANELVAVVDETAPAIGAGILYVLTSALLLEPAAVLAALRGPRRRTLRLRLA